MENSEIYPPYCGNLRKAPFIVWHLNCLAINEHISLQCIGKQRLLLRSIYLPALGPYHQWQSIATIITNIRNITMTNVTMHGASEHCLACISLY